MMRTKVTAGASYGPQGPDHPQEFHVTIAGEFGAVVELAAIIGAGVVSVEGRREDNSWGVLYWAATKSGRLTPRKGNARNEAGIARYHSIMERLAKARQAPTWVATYANSYPTRAAFEDALGTE